MIIYIDNDFKCHAQNDGTMREIEASFFDGKCDEFIEGYRFVPDGETWAREDGTVFHGEMISPWKDYSQLSVYQSIYERMLEQQADIRSALNVLYEGDME